jgi:hypothetical protein
VSLSPGLRSSRERRSNCKHSRRQANLHCIGSSARRWAGWRPSGQYAITPLNQIANHPEWLSAFKIQSFFERQNDFHLNQSQVRYSLVLVLFEPLTFADCTGPVLFSLRWTSFLAHSTLRYHHDHCDFVGITGGRP